MADMHHLSKKLNKKRGFLTLHTESEFECKEWGKVSTLLAEQVHALDY